MNLEGVMKGEEYYPACGTHKGTLYRIVQERGRFLLEAVSIGIGIGMKSCPVGFFGDGWEGVYSWTAKRPSAPTPDRERA